MEILLRCKDQLKINIDERAKGKNALYYAATRGGPDIYNLLAEHGADEDLIVSDNNNAAAGKPISKLFEKHFPRYSFSFEYH